MNAVKLTDLIPEKQEIQLYVKGELKQFYLRPKTLADDAWVTQNWGDQNAIQKVFETFDAPKIGKLLFRLCEPKEPLAGYEVEEYDDDGKKVTRFKPGWEILLEGVRGQQHFMSIVTALLRTWGLSEPMVDQLEKKTQDKTDQK